MDAADGMTVPVRNDGANAQSATQSPQRSVTLAEQLTPYWPFGWRRATIEWLLVALVLGSLSLFAWGGVVLAKLEEDVQGVSNGYLLIISMGALFVTYLTSPDFITERDYGMRNIRGYVAWYHQCPLEAVDALHCDVLPRGERPVCQPEGRPHPIAAIGIPLGGWFHRASIHGGKSNDALLPLWLQLRLSHFRVACAPCDPNAWPYVHLTDERGDRVTLRVDTALDLLTTAHRFSGAHGTEVDDTLAQSLGHIIASTERERVCHRDAAQQAAGVLTDANGAHAREIAAHAATQRAFTDERAAHAQTRKQHDELDRTRDRVIEVLNEERIAHRRTGAAHAAAQAELNATRVELRAEREQLAQSKEEIGKLIVIRDRVVKERDDMQRVREETIRILESMLERLRDTSRIGHSIEGLRLRGALLTYLTLDGLNGDGSRRTTYLRERELVNEKLQRAERRAASRAA